MIRAVLAIAVVAMFTEAPAVSAPPSKRSAASAKAANVPKCDRSIANEEVLEGQLPQADMGHAVTIKNGSQGAAAVKLENLDTGEQTLLYVLRGQSANIPSLPDGRYKLQYAIGGYLAADCQTVVAPSSVGELPGLDNLRTRETADGYVTSRMSYTLYTVPGGNMKPKPVSLEEFNGSEIGTRKAYHKRLGE